MEETEIKQNFSNNLITLRKAKNITQLQLAESLNYSDKSVSKWENGNVLPDIVTLTMIAEFFGVTLDELIRNSEPPKTVINKKKYVIITLLSCGLAVFLTITAFMTMLLCGFVYSWLCFPAGVTVTVIVALVLSCVWFDDKIIVLFTSLVNWSLITTIFLILLVPYGINLWLLFPIAFVLEILILLGYTLKTVLKKSPKKNKEKANL